MLIVVLLVFCHKLRKYGSRRIKEHLERDNVFQEAAANNNNNNNNKKKKKKKKKKKNDIHSYINIKFKHMILELIIAFLLILGILALIKEKSVPVFDKISNNLLIISGAIWLLGAGLYLTGYYNAEIDCQAIFPRAIISAFKMFIVSNDLVYIDEELKKSELYMTTFSLVHFAAAFIAFLFIFKMIGYKIKSSFNIKKHKWFYSKGKTVHLFWGVNEASCLLAEDISKNVNYAGNTIIFIDVDDENDDNLQEKATLSYITNAITIKGSEMARLDAIGALVAHCYNGPAAINSDNRTDIFGRLHLKDIGTIIRNSAKSYFYFLSNDESKNIAGALNLQKDTTLSSMQENRPEIYVHARRDANNEVFDHYSQYDSESQRMKIKIVDSAFLSIEALKQDKNALPVGCIQFDKATGTVNDPFTALIVGFGGTGQEAFKFLYEYSAFVGSDMKRNRFKCYAIDEKMDSMSGLIREKMPEIDENELSLINTYIDSIEYWKTIKRIIKELNYAVIALNNDATGLTHAVNLFKYAMKERAKESPKLKIMLRCYNSCNEKRMTEVKDNLNRSGDGNVEIQLYGQEKSLYQCSTILSDDTLKEAKEFNRVYENSDLTAEEQWKKSFGEDEIVKLMADKKITRYHAIYDINRRISQNISNSHHSLTKLILMGIDENGQSDRLMQFYNHVKSREGTPTIHKNDQAIERLIVNIAIVEHERWTASHKLMGYTYGKTKDYVKKQHNCICTWKEVEESTQSYDRNAVYATIKIAYEKRDKKEYK